MPNARTRGLSSSFPAAKERGWSVKSDHDGFSLSELFLPHRSTSAASLFLIFFHLRNIERKRLECRNTGKSQNTDSIE